ncbi:MAG: hypothetical protein PHY47_26080 [Lachnospiraceae bacterium]|nr:hypothetical protein [Lachnospiraceae bacterium]
MPQKYQAYPFSYQTAKNYLEILYTVIRCSIVICSTDEILSAKGICLLEGSSISTVLSAYVKTQQPQIFKEKVYATNSDRFPVDSMIPVRNPDDHYSGAAQAFLLKHRPVLFL